MSYDLTQGAIEEIMTGTDVQKPVLQVLGQKKIAGSGGGSDRYRILLSDGIYSHSSAMLATQLNDLVVNKQLETFAVIRLDKYIVNKIQPDRRVMILLDLEILADGGTVGTRLGTPAPFKTAGQGGNTAECSDNTAAEKPITNGHAKSEPAPVTPVRKPPSFGGATQGLQNPPDTPGGTPSRVHPINSLTPYQNRWYIKARVTSKSNIRTWSNSRGEGKLFNMSLLDDSGEIRATAFKNECDKFYEMIDINKVYFIRKASLKTADKRYSSLKNDYEMTFNGETEMILCEDEGGLPSVSFNFIPINQLESHQPNTTVDVIGIVKQTADVSTVMSRAQNKEIKKRDVQLIDENQVMIRLTLWGSDAETFNGEGNPVLVVKGAKLSDWSGRSLSTISGSQMICNPDIPEAHRIRGWYDSMGHSLEYSEYRNEGGQGSSTGGTTNWKTFGEVKTENLGQERADYFTTKGTIIFLKKENSMYMACPQQECNKKVVDQSNGFYRCEKCQKEYPNYKWRMILSMNLADYTDNQWVTCFQDTAEAILGRSGEELGQLKETDEPGFENVFTEATFKSYYFRMRAKVETYNDESRLKTVCVGANPIDFREYNKKLVTDIEKLLY